MQDLKPWILIFFLLSLLTGCPKTAATSGEGTEESYGTDGDTAPQNTTEKPLCTRSAQVDCIANRQFPAMAVLDDEADVTNLNSENFQDVLKSDAPFEYWDATGKRHQGQGSGLLVAANIKQGVSILGVSGNLGVSDLLCKYATQATCVADNACQWTNGACSLDPWNIRNGKAIAGVNGVLPTNCWTIDGACSASVWKDLTADGACDNATDDCVMQDRINGLIFSESSPNPGTAAGTSVHITDWYSGISLCDSLNFANYTDWRMPTYKEMHEAFTHGIRDLGYKGSGVVRGAGTLDNNDAFLGDVDGRLGNPFNMGFWTATTVPGQTADAYYIDFDGGPYITPFMKYNGAQVLCVRP